MVKAWIGQTEVFDVFLGLSWMRRVHYNPHYGLGTLTISGDDMKVGTVPAQLFPMESGSPNVDFDEEDEENTQLMKLVSYC